MEASERLQVLKDEWTGCKKCGLHVHRDGDQIVFGRGVVPADYLFVGTWPNGEDVEYTVPFLSQQGEIIHMMMSKVGIAQDDVFFTYVLACRPTIYIPATEYEEERIDERQPDKTEVEACLPRLYEIIYQVDPRIIVTFGLLPMQVIVHKGKGIRSLAGKTGTILEGRVPGRIEQLRYPVIGAVGTDMLLKNPSGASHGPHVTTLTALKRAKDYVIWLRDKQGEEA